MFKKIALILLAASLFCGPRASATTVIPPSFDQLVGQAEFIFQGEVTNVRSLWVGEGSQRHIDTYITFKVADVLKGEAASSYTMRVFGGTVGDESMGISDAPEFAVGDNDILFVENNGQQVVPLVGIMHGRFRVERDNSGEEVVTDSEHDAVRDVAELGRPEAAGAVSMLQRNLSVLEFKNAIRGKLESRPTDAAAAHAQ